MRGRAFRFWVSSWAGVCSVLAYAGSVWAFDGLFSHVRVDRSLAAGFQDSDTEADVQDGFLIGVGRERVRRLPDGRLSIERWRRYTAVRNADTHAVAKLPEPWSVHANVLLEPTLRVIRVDTRFDFKPSGDHVFSDTTLSEKYKWLFEADHTLLRAVDQGRRLQLQSFRQGKGVKQQTYDYPVGSAPLDVVGLVLALAVQRSVDQFDFDLIAPDGSVHGIEAKVTRTRDLRGFAKGYRVPKERLVTPAPVAMVDMRLASPIKYLFFPHHFFMAFASEQPDQLLMMWGGDPDTNLQAFRREPPRPEH
ncbi:MAG: hypothetical protein RL701_3534 [Pseudomonadota bacterium]